MMNRNTSSAVLSPLNLISLSPTGLAEAVNLYDATPQQWSEN